MSQMDSGAALAGVWTESRRLPGTQTSSLKPQGAQRHRVSWAFQLEDMFPAALPLEENLRSSFDACISVCRSAPWLAGL